MRIGEPARGPDHPHTAYALTGLAKVHLARGRPADALRLAERAVRLREASGAAAELIAESRFALARGLWDAPVGRDRERARAEARAAVGAYRSAGAVKATQLAEVETWLLGHKDNEAR